MAVEKLILRSILYGADKIPDSWFEKLPGGYYKDAQGNTRKIGDKADSPKRESKHGERRAEHNDFYRQDYREGRGRRQQRDRDRERSRSSYDGGVDEDYYQDSGDGRSYYRSKSHGVLRKYDVDDRHNREDRRRREGHNDFRRRSQDGYDSDRHARSSPLRETDYRRRQTEAYIDRPTPRLRPHSFDPGLLAAADAPYPRGDHLLNRWAQSSPAQSTIKGSNSGYVPYAHVYGDSHAQSPLYGRSAGTPLHDFASASQRNRPWEMSQSPLAYQQSPLPQPDAGVGAAFTDRSGIIPQDSRNVSTYRPSPSDRYDARPARSRHILDTARSASFNDFDSRGNTQRSVHGQYNGRGGYQSERFVDTHEASKTPSSAEQPKPRRRKEGRTNSELEDV